MSHPANSGYDPATFWDERCLQFGTTGSDDRIFYRYNQPIRLKMLDVAVSHLGIDLKGLRILDVGCGVGIFIEEFARRGAVVTATDISKEVLAKARERVGDMENITLLHQRVEETDFPPHSFDLVTSIAVLQHVVNPELFNTALDRIVSVVKPQGHLLLMESAPRAFRKPRSGGFMANRTRDDWVRAFRERGCSLAYERCYPELGIRLVESLRGGSLLLLSGFSPARIAETRAAVLGRRGDGASSFLYRVYALGETILHTLARPYDHWLLMPLPSKWSVVRLMVFVKREA